MINIVTGQEKGYQITYSEEDKQWIYVDTKEPIETNPRPCKRCGNLPTPEGHDHCLGKLPGVKNACCGHGYEEGYISFENGITIRGFFTTDKAADKT